MQEKESDTGYRGQVLTDIAEWRRLGESALAEIGRRIENISTEIPPEDIAWQQIAEKHSAEWKRAHQELKSAEAHLQKQVSDPHHAPLGIIGAVLESEITAEVEEEYNLALARFTIENEGLCQTEPVREEISGLRHSMLKRMETIEKLRELNGKLSRLTDELGQLSRHDEPVPDIDFCLPVFTTLSAGQIATMKNMGTDELTLKLDEMAEVVSQSLVTIRQHPALQRMAETQKPFALRGIFDKVCRALGATPSRSSAPSSQESVF